MDITAAAEARASRMGARAGEAFRLTGVPVPNPFDETHPDLANAWRVAYLAAIAA